MDEGQGFAERVREPGALDGVEMGGGRLGEGLGLASLAGSSGGPDRPVPRALVCACWSQAGAQK